MNRSYPVDMVLGADEFPSSGHSVGNAVSWLVSELMFTKGQGRPTPAAMWNGPEHWCLQLLPHNFRLPPPDSFIKQTVPRGK